MHIRYILIICRNLPRPGKYFPFFDAILIFDALITAVIVGCKTTEKVISILCTKPYFNSS